MTTVEVLAVPTSARHVLLDRYLLEVTLAVRAVSDETTPPAWFMIWPAVVANSRFEAAIVTVAQDGSLVEVGAAVVPMSVDSVLWRYLTAAIWTPSRPHSIFEGRIETYSATNVLRATKKRLLRRLLSGQVLPASVQTTRQELAALEAFWRSHDVPSTGAASRVSTTPSLSSFSLLASRHPFLGRKMGFVGSATIVVTAGNVALRRLFCQARVSLNGVPTETPLTATQVNLSPSLAFFVPAKSLTSIALPSCNGLEQCRGSGLDPDNYVVESLDFMADQFRERQRLSHEDPKPAIPDAQHAGGLYLIARDALLHATRRHLEQKGVVEHNRRVLYRDGLLIGYRVDVLHDNELFSLCSRRASYEFTTQQQTRYDVGVTNDEGFVEPVGLDSGGTPTVNELLCEWSDWGLSTIRPGKRIPDDGTSRNAVLSNLVVTLKQPRQSIPKLRWGRTYQFGLRAVYWGGVSLSLSDATKIIAADDTASTRPFVFDRTEPLVSPLVLEPPGDPSRSGDADRYCSADVSGSRNINLIFVPPPMTLDRCLRAGAFDSYSPDDSYTLLQLVGGGLGVVPTLDGSSVGKYLPDSDVVAAMLQIQLVGRDALGSAETPHSATRMYLGWLSDNTATMVIPFYGQEHRWPYPRAIHLRIRAARRGPSWCSNEPRVSGRRAIVQVGLAPGDSIDLRLSSAFSINRLTLTGRTASHFSWYRWTNEILGPSAPAITRGLDALIERAVMPPRVMRIIHATASPAADPALSSPVVMRTLGETTAQLVDTPSVDVATTAAVSVEYKWTDIDDRVGQDKPKTESRRGASEPFPIEMQVTADEPRLKVLLAFPDTGARRVSARLVGRPRYESFFVAHNVPSKTRVSTEVVIDVPNAQVPPPPTIISVRPLYRFERNSEGTSFASRRISRYRVYLARPRGVTGVGELFGVVCQPFPRDTAPAAADAARARYLVSQWGSEVLLATAALPSGPYAEDFPDAVLVRNGVVGFSKEVAAAHGIKDALVVAGHSIAFDEQYGVWYSDVSINAPGTYLPWLQFACVTFQPSSIPGCHTSEIVLTQFCQIAPDRSLTAVRPAGDRTLLDVTVAGVSAESGVSISEPMVTVSVQKPLEHSSETLWSTIAGPFQLVRTGDHGPAGGWVGRVRIGDAKGMRLEIAEQIVDTRRSTDQNGKRLVYLEHVYLH
jgi:hypothetical protein